MQPIETFLIFSVQINLQMLRTIFTTIIIIAAVQISAAQEETKQFHFALISENQQVESELIQQLKENPDDFSLNYKLATYYYNEAVNSIESLDYNAANLENEQGKIELLFTKALQPALLAHRKNQEHEDVLTMLSGIYFGLNDMRMSDYYKGLLSK